MGAWQFFQDEFLGMKWLNRLIGNVLSLLGLDIDLSSIKTLSAALRKKTKRILPAPNANFNNSQQIGRASCRERV